MHPSCMNDDVLYSTCAVLQMCKAFRDGGGVLPSAAAAAGDGSGDGDAGEMDDDEVDAILGKFKARGYQYGSEEFANVKLSRMNKFEYKVPKASERPRDAAAAAAAGASMLDMSWLSLSLFPTSNRKPPAGPAAAAKGAPAAGGRPPAASTGAKANVVAGDKAATTASVAATAAAGGTGRSELLMLMQIITLLVLIYILFSISWKIGAIESHMRTIAAAAQNTGASSSSSNINGNGEVLKAFVEQLGSALAAGMTELRTGLSSQQAAALQSVTAAMQEQQERSHASLLKMIEALAGAKLK